jgi:hypothetical protein
MFKELAQQYTSFYKENKKTLEELKEIYLKDKRIFHFQINKKVSFTHHKGIPEFYIQRGEALRLLFQKTIEIYPVSKEVECFVYIGDELPKLYQKLPIFTFAKKSKEPGILIPDWTFMDPYTSTLSKSWDELKESVYNTCPDKINYKKVLFFRGRNTSSTTPHNIRKKIEDLSKKNKYIDIKLNPVNIQSIDTWCDYKYFLDLPGSSPWSVRFKELFLLKSMIVKVETTNSIDHVNENYYINFYTPMFVPNKDFVRLVYIYDKPNGFHDFSNEMKKTFDYYNKYNTQYNNIVKNGRKTIQNLTISNILYYMSCIFKEYTNCIINVPTVKSILDKSRPCASKSRAGNRYKKEELLALANNVNIQFPSKITIDEMCKRLAAAFKNEKIVTKVIPPKKSSDDIFNVFKKEFHNELVGWIENKKAPRYKTVLKGGQNLKSILKEKYNMTSPPTVDYDFTISTKYPQPTFDEWFLKVKSFVQRHSDVLTMKVNYFYPNKIVNVLKIQKYFTIFIFYKNQDFIDLAFTNEVFQKKDIDKELSKKTGLPIQTLLSTFREITNLIYRESVIKQIYSYKKRNAFVGMTRSKGIKDLNRFEMICKIRHFKPQCNLLKELHYHFPITEKYLDAKGPHQFSRFTNLIKTFLK